MSQRSGRKLHQVYNYLQNIKIHTPHHWKFTTLELWRTDKAKISSGSKFGPDNAWGSRGGKGITWQGHRLILKGTHYALRTSSNMVGGPLSHPRHWQPHIGLQQDVVQQVRLNLVLPRYALFFSTPHLQENTTTTRGVNIIKTNQWYILMRTSSFLSLSLNFHKMLYA